MRRALAAHPEVLQWLIEGRDLNPILEAAELKGALGGRIELPRDLMPRVLNPVLSLRLKESTLESRLSALSHLPDDHFIGAGLKIRDQIDRLDLGQSGAVRMLSNPRTELGVADETLAGLMERVLPKYYSRLNRIDKANIVMGQLRIKPKAALTDQLRALLMDSGPCMQKLFQLVGKDVKRADLAVTMGALQNEIKPFGFDEVRQAIESRAGGKLEDLFKSIDPKPLAAASVGQVHRAELKDGTIVAVKVRRPGLQKKGEREIAGLLEAASGEPMATELLTRVGNTVKDEMDFRNEARNIDLGLVYSRPDRGISIAQRMEVLSPAEDVIVSRLAPGAKISQFDPNDLRQVALRTQAIEALLENWFDAVIFGNGFFHGDLHPGNVFFKESAASPTGYELTVIDFGNAGSLSVEERKAFVELILAAQTPNPSRMLETLSALGKVPESKRGLLLASFEQIVQTHPAADARVDRALMLALENGMEIPGSFIAFNRGRTFLEKELIGLGEHLARLDPAGKYAAPSVQRIYRNLALKRVTQSIMGSLFKSDVKTTQVITPGMLVRALGDNVRRSAKHAGSSCIHAFRSLFVDLVF